MRLPCRIIHGYNSIWHPKQCRWIRGKCLVVMLDEGPHGRVIKIPVWALLGEYQPGEIDTHVDVSAALGDWPGWEWLIERERELFLQEFG